MYTLENLKNSPEAEIYYELVKEINAFTDLEDEVGIPDTTILKWFNDSPNFAEVWNKALFHISFNSRHEGNYLNSQMVVEN